MKSLSVPVTRSFRLELCVGILVYSGLVNAAEWPQFRGVNSSGVVEEGIGITEFGHDKNVRWKIPVGEGHSSPCIAGDNIFITTSDREDRTLSIVCISRESGDIKWERMTKVREFEKGHPSFNPASSSPATDGEVVVAYFGSYGLICYDMEGTKKWNIRMPLTRSFAGNATSPAIIDNKVVLYRGNQVDHFILAVDKNSGEEIWKIPQAEKFINEMSCTACPVRYKDMVLFHGARSVQALDIESGEMKWMTKCATTATSTPVLADNQIIVAAWNKMGEPALRPELPEWPDLVKKHDKNMDGTISKNEWPTLWLFHRPLGFEAPMNGGTIRFHMADRNRNGSITQDEWPQLKSEVALIRSGYKTHGILAIDLDGKGLIDKSQVKSLTTRGIPEIPSPLYHNGLVYFVKNGGLLTCIDLKSGKRVYNERTGGSGTHYASPIIAGDHLFTISGEGQISVVSLGPDPEILKVNEIGEKIYATPAVVDRVLYVRTHDHLYAFGATGN